MTTVSIKAFQNGERITPGVVTHMSPTQLTLIDPQTLPTPLHPGVPLAAGLQSPTQKADSPAAGHGMPAPKTILVGGDPAAEKALLQNHPNILARALGISHNEPIRAREGATLGGRYEVGGTVGEYRGNAFSRGGGTSGTHSANGERGGGPIRSFGSSSPQVLGHSQSSGAVYGGGTVHASGGGGFSGGASTSSGVSSGGHSSGGGSTISSGGGSSGGTHGGGGSAGSSSAGGHH